VLSPGSPIDIWVVERALGQGGMGSVYRCYNRDAPRILAAVKVLDAGMSRIQSVKARFVREAEILFTLNHRHIVKVRNVRMEGELPYIEMEFINGESLEARINQGPCPLPEALNLLGQAADALAYMHRMGVRHRDLKPSNILVEGDGTLKIVDFGIAADLQGEAITRTDEAFGSVSYAPPEWVDPKTLDPVKWDLYALGVVFYELVAGRMAFPMASGGSHRQQAMRLMMQKQSHPPLDPGEGYPEGVRALIRDLTTSSPAERLGSADLVMERVRALRGVEMGPVTAPAAPAMRSHEVTWYEGAGETLTAEPSAETPNLPTGVAATPNLALNAAPNLTPVAAPEPTPTAGATLAPSLTIHSDGLAEAPAAPASTPDAVAPTTSSRAIWGVAALCLLAVLGLGAALWSGAGPFERPAGDADAAEGSADVLTPPDVPRRPLELVVTGLPSGTPFGARLDGLAPDAQDGFVLRFAGVSLGDHTLSLFVGPGCDTPAGETPPVWCSRREESVRVEAGDSPQLRTVSLLPPTLRDLRLSVPNLKASLSLRWGDEPPQPIKGDALRREDVSPGAYPVELIAGECPDTARGCDAKGDCPPGCVSWLGEVIVPVGDGEHLVSLSLREPTPKAGAAEGAAPSKARRQVSQGDFARWLATHPEWLKEAAQQADKADKKYLKGWAEDGTPPSPGAALVNVSWYAAQAYCAGRGGLAPLDAEPLTWEEGGGLAWHEHRQSGGAPAWRRSDGSTSTNVTPSESGQFIGVRCVR
jgi:predicted Ser/Thr protein kinase